MIRGCDNLFIEVLIKIVHCIQRNTSRLTTTIISGDSPCFYFYRFSQVRIVYARFNATWWDSTNQIFGKPKEAKALGKN